MHNSRRRRNSSEAANRESDSFGLFEHNPCPTWVYDPETLRFLAANKAAILVYGYSLKEFLAMRIADIQLPEQESATPKQLEGTAITQQRHRKKDGSILNVESTLYETILDKRRVRVEICAEISGRGGQAGKTDPQSQELERRVQERTNQLEATNRELEAFCYSVSHDLKAPLRSILGFSEVLLERYSARLDSRGQELLRRVCESSQTMDHLIEDLLKLSRVSRVELQRRPVNLSVLAEKIAADLRGAEPSRKVRFIAPKELVAHGDERLLEMVLDNLLRNAWKFTSKRPDPVIELGLTNGSEGEFFVHDNGVGFDMAFANKLFGVFQRLHSPSEFSGTGVGLAIVQRIINRHGGKTRAEGKVGQGATFYFTLHSG